MERGETEDRVCFKRFQGRPGVFPTDPVPLIFPFLTRQGVQLAHPFIPLLICPLLMLCGSAAGRLHAGERQEIVTRNRVGFCDILS
jgi:hypothetical protein